MGSHVAVSASRDGPAVQLAPLDGHCPRCHGGPQTTARHHAHTRVEERRPHGERAAAAASTEGQAAGPGQAGGGCVARGGIDALCWFAGQPDAPTHCRRREGGARRRRAGQEGRHTNHRRQKVISLHQRGDPSGLHEAPQPDPPQPAAGQGAGGGAHTAAPHLGGLPTLARLSLPLHASAHRPARRPNAPAIARGLACQKSA
mmetsp:Transcript_41283/g.117278  ORF Transcript_41283/g.117278 Transcript_41283/m.117278 type:complete len:202 (+) Transcript_41283:1050-1655(+)